MIATYTVALALSAPAPAPAPAPESEREAATSDADADSEAEADAAPSEPESDSEADPSDSPAPLPSPDRSGPSGRVGAVGGRGHTPLPPPPRREDPGTIVERAWRGRGFFELRVDAAFPVGGEPIAGGNVISGLGGLALGWRASEIVALSTGVSTFIHDARSETILDEFGEQTDVRTFGRITVFDLGALRAHVPVRGRVQPYGEIGAGVGWYVGPRADTRPAVGTARGGIGLDVWLGPTFSLGLGVDYRLVAIRNSVGHRLQTGLRATIHW